VLIMFVCDTLFNGFVSPVYLLAAGAVMGLVPDARTVAALRGPAPRPMYPPQYAGYPGPYPPPAYPQAHQPYPSTPHAGTP
jgi:hypothetical protein